MNGKERVLTLLRGELADRVPVAPMATYATAHLAGIPVARAATDPALMARCLQEGQEAAGSDVFYLGWASSFNLAAAALGCAMTVPADDVPAVKAPLLAGDRPDPERIDPALIEQDAGVAVGAAAGRLLRAGAGDTRLVFAYVPGPFTLAGLLRGSEQLLMDALDEPDLVARLVARTEQACLAFARTRAEAGAQVLVVADPMASASLISPALFRRLAREPLGRLLAGIREQLDRIPSLHICGETTPILPDLAQLGPAILEVDHQVDLAAAREVVGPGLVLQGNLDPALLLAGPVEAIRAEAARCLAACQGHPFILSTGCEVALRTPLAHYQVL